MGPPTDYTSSVALSIAIDNTIKILIESGKFFFPEKTVYTVYELLMLLGNQHELCFLNTYIQLKTAYLAVIARYGEHVVNNLEIDIPVNF
jgi:hypothetical protein